MVLAWVTLQLFFLIKKKKQLPLFHLLSVQLAEGCIVGSALALHCFLVEAVSSS
jgi:hypothetical protein